ncbi:MAG: transglycosylase family protein [Solirubrobacteraceae bacterium]
MRRLIPLVLVALFVAVPVAGGQDEDALRNRIGAGKAAEKALSSAAARLGALERAASREVALMEGRLSEAQSELDRAEAAADLAASQLADARKRVARLKIRLSEVEDQLAENLRERYMGDQPDLVSVVLDAHGFADLLETVQFLKTIQDRNTMILDLVKDARADAGRERRRLVVLTERRRKAEAAATQRRNALAQIASGLRARRDALSRAHAARLAALSSVRARRVAAEKELGKLLEERRRASMVAGPGGPWAIPWAVVQCESGGQNLPPNYAGASGYYQFMPATWQGLGGSTPQAYQAPKAEQDRLAAELWAGGAGAGNWVCASLVGII